MYPSEEFISLIINLSNTLYYIYSLFIIAEIMFTACHFRLQICFFDVLSKTKYSMLIVDVLSSKVV